MRQIQTETSSTIFSLELGTKSVAHIEQFMTEIVRLRSLNKIPDFILILNHPRTIALGLRDKKEMSSKDILVSNETIEHSGVSVFYSNRGGGASYHWPGQLIVYPILSLQTRERDISQYIWNLEEIGVNVLSHLGISVKRRSDSTAHRGLWIGNQKIMSIGTRISGWITSYGFALNLNYEPDINHFVRPCGIESASYITVEELLSFAPSRNNLIKLIKTEITNVFGRVFADIPDLGKTIIHDLVVGGERCQIAI